MPSVGYWQRALADIKEIGRFTIHNRGAYQADKYVTTCSNATKQPWYGPNPHLWR